MHCYLHDPGSLRGTRAYTESMAITEAQSTCETVWCMPCTTSVKYPFTILYDNMCVYRFVCLCYARRILLCRFCVLWRNFRPFVLSNCSAESIQSRQEFVKVIGIQVKCTEHFAHWIVLLNLKICSFETSFSCCNQILCEFSRRDNKE